MEELSWFWSGAVQLPVADVLQALTEREHPWSAPITPELLREVGCSQEQVAAWQSCRPVRTSGTAVTLADPRYPALLRTLRHPPPVLFVEGRVERLAERGIGVVGTRRCTAYGRAVARHLAHAAAEAGLVVVSGLARGIDGEAHTAALVDGRTVAVLGHGLGHTSPSHHRRLRAQIVASGGAVVSTWPDDVEARPWMFPRRNRWIAGLSEVVVVVEAGQRSGALITARDAAAEGREVAVVPGPLGAPASMGCLALLREGAAVVSDVEAFVAALVGEPATTHDAWLGDVFAGVPLDEVARRHRRGAAELVAELTRLEVEGVVVRRPGQRYAPARRPA